MAREAFHAVAGPSNAWSRGIAFQVHFGALRKCKTDAMKSANTVPVIQIPVLGFLAEVTSLSQTYCRPDNSSGNAFEHDNHQFTHNPKMFP
jgi:hypothetical protein